MHMITGEGTFNGPQQFGGKQNTQYTVIFQQIQLKYVVATRSNTLLLTTLTNWHIAH